MTSYRLTPAAQHDLSSIWDWTAEHRNLEQAETYVGELRAAIERIAQDPRRGRDRGDLRAGYSSYSVASHVLFYRRRAHGGVDIVRILHQRMDPSRHL